MAAQGLKPGAGLGGLFGPAEAVPLLQSRNDADVEALAEGLSEAGAKARICFDLLSGTTESRALLQGQNDADVQARNDADVEASTEGSSEAGAKARICFDMPSGTTESRALLQSQNDADVQARNDADVEALAEGSSEAGAKARICFDLPSGTTESRALLQGFPLSDPIVSETAPVLPEPGLGARRRVLSRSEYVDGILRGDRTILSRAITLIESSRAADREMADEIVEACLPHSGGALRVGITGVPGAGKSTLIEALGQYLIGERGQTVAVLAIDPTSQLTGGSILGDKTRMVSLAACEKAFIRPSPSRTSHGGVARRTREAMLLCEAAGYENILVETVGVGQSETAVHGMVDFFLLIVLAGAGDELQGMKRGVMELADLIVVNKADGENLAAAERTRADAETALHFFAGHASGWKPRALACSALTGCGVEELWVWVREFAGMVQSNGWMELNRREQRRRWMRESLEQGLAQMFRAHPAIRQNVAEYEREVLEGRTTPFRAARKLLEIYAGSGRRGAL